MKITDQILPAGEYYDTPETKVAIVIHHTAGSHRPDYTIDAWTHDKAKNGGVLPVGTAYVIGGISTRNNDASFDGHIYRAFDDKYWAHHLGTSAVNNTDLNKHTIAIEICNYGPVHKTPDGKFLNYVNSEIPANMVGSLDKPFKGFSYYHKYTEAQLASLKELLLDISKRHHIDLKRGMQELITAGTAFEINMLALSGKPGLWTHVNFRNDKSDCWPQPQLIDLIKSL